MSKITPGHAHTVKVGRMYSESDPYLPRYTIKFNDLPRKIKKQIHRALMSRIDKNWIRKEVVITQVTYDPWKTIKGPADYKRYFVTNYSLTPAK